MSKMAFMPMLIASLVAVILLSAAMVVANVYVYADEPRAADTGKFSQAIRAPPDSGNNNNNNNNGGGGSSGDNPTDKIPVINKLFTGNGGSGGGHNNHRKSMDDSSSNAVLNNLPVIPKLNFNATNSTSTSSTTATVTIPVCDGQVPGPCFDKSTRQIIP